MKVSERWLREWIDPAIEGEQLSDQLTMLGLEVDDVAAAGPDLTGFVVGRIDKAEPHPDADKLQVCTVDVGEDAPETIVCGAPNARDGLTVAVARVGARMPDGMKIKKARLRGQSSAGMLCSAFELALGSEGDGIMELDAAARPGTPLAEHLGLPDTVYEIDLTPNRGDCLSMLGVAREVAVINELTLDPPTIEPVPEAIDTAVKVAIHAPELCPGYAARCIFDVDPAAQSPDWLKERLRRAGVRAINLPVDIGNLVMLECGQPMHAFDYDKLHGGLQVRRCGADESIDTLDGEHVALNAGTLVIADDKAPVAVAGMIGGADSAVSHTTTRVVFEAASFTPAAVVGQGRVYKIHTDSSHRFERGVDPELHRHAIERASHLLARLGGGRVGPVVAEKGDPVWDDRTITLRDTALKRLLGQSIPAQDITRILEALGMTVSGQAGTWQVTPPSWRYDINIEADLVEEVARVYGYNRLETDAAGVVLPEIRVSETRQSERDLLSALQQRGYSEAITYSFIDPALQEQLVPEGERIALNNPIAEQLAHMRETLWASLLPAWAYNKRRQQDNIRLYERGLRFYPDKRAEHGIAQIDTLAGIVDGNARPTHWHDAQHPVDFFDIKGDVEALLSMGGHRARFVPERHPALHPGRCAAVCVHGRRIGWLGQLAPRFARMYKGRTLPYLFELDYELVGFKHQVEYSAISEQPSVHRDLAVVVADSIPAGDLVESIESLQDDTLRDIGIFDVFRPNDLEDGLKSVALSLNFQDKTSTLTDSVIDEKTDLIIETLRARHGARIRGA